MSGGTATTPNAPAVDIAALVRNEFQRLPVPDPSPQMQPEGRTLVNLDTVLYDSGPQHRTWNITLVGRAVSVRAQPTAWRWDTGDGGTVTSSSPGRPYPSADVTHNYRRAGDYSLTLTTTWTGEFSVENGPWSQISGTVTRAASTPMHVLQASPQLVSGS